MTFAETAEIIGKKKGKYEKLSTSVAPEDRNTADRMLQRINTTLSLLKDAHESMPQSGGQTKDTPKKGFGDWVNKASAWATENKDVLSNLGSAAADFAISQAAISSASGPQAPVLSPYVNDYETADVSPQINAINRDVVLNNRQVDSTFRNENTAQAYKSKNFISGLNAKNGVYANAQEQDRQARRMKMYTDHKTNLYNASLINQHNSDLVDFSNNRAIATSNNFSNSVRNFKLGQNDTFQNNLDKVKLGIMEKQFEDSGVLDRMMQDPTISARLKELFPEMF